jgi:uncharacterized protein HemX
MKSDQALIYAVLIIAVVVLMAAVIGYWEWKRIQRRREFEEIHEREFAEKRRQEERELDDKRRDEDLARQQKFEAAARELEERRIEAERSPPQSM